MALRLDLLVCDGVIFASSRIFGRDPDRIIVAAADGISAFNNSGNHPCTPTKP